MRIERFGVVLESLARSHLECLRTWRNKEENRHFMEFQQVISPAEQEAWFESIDEHRNLFFIYGREEKAAGFLQVKNIDPEAGFGEAGIVHGREESLQTTLPVIAIIVLMETVFDLVGLDRLRAKMKRDNTHAQRMNQRLGYKRMPGQREVPFPYYEVTKAAFKRHSSILRKSLAHMHGLQTKVTADPVADAFWRERFRPPAEFEFLDPDGFILAPSA